MDDARTECTRQLSEPPAQEAAVAAVTACQEQAVPIWTDGSKMLFTKEHIERVGGVYDSMTPDGAFVLGTPKPASNGTVLIYLGGPNRPSVMSIEAKRLAYDQRFGVGLTTASLKVEIDAYPVDPRDMKQELNETTPTPYGYVAIYTLQSPP